MRNKFTDFLKSPKDHMYLVAFASGLYPFLHFYNGNLSLADSLMQGLRLAFVCFIIPLVLMHAAWLMVRVKPFGFFKTSYLAIINLSVFSMLLVRIIFRLQKEMSVLILLLAIIAGLLLHKHLKKIVVLQLLLAAISFMTLIPRLMFALRQDNTEWSSLPTELLEAKFVHTPNIFVIQPDGYVNFSEMDKSPYAYDNSNFQDWLKLHNFNNYPNFRSNYGSTLTSNSSMFAMSHHYYSNTNPTTLKTFNANNIIVGNENNVLKILKNNQYSSYLITDNSYFLSNRRELFFDFTNVPSDKIYSFTAGDIEGMDLLADFSTTLDTISSKRNFFFVEKVIPTHISPTKRWSQGAKQERIDYLKRIEEANIWLKALITKIVEYDKNAMVIIVADHGGYVGLDYTNEIHERKLKDDEIVSTFSSILSIKWPNDVSSEHLEFKTNVNLFRQIFYGLSKNDVFIKNTPKNSSYLQLKTEGEVIVYEALNEYKKPVFNQISKD